MKKIHLLNIGFPRCGTSWLWANLNKHPGINFHSFVKENDFFFNDKNFINYQDQFLPYEISANFNPNLWMIDQELIKFLGNYATHVSIILRNPYSFAERYYDFIKHNQSHNEFIEWLLFNRFFDYSNIVRRWTNNLPSNTIFKIFYFDDLEHNPTDFLSKYFEFINIDVIIDDTHKQRINQNLKTEKTKLTFTDEQKSIINNYIDNFSQLSEKNLTNWKR